MNQLFAYTDYSTHGSQTAEAAAAGLVGLVMLIAFAMVLAAYALQAYLLGRIFQKAGQKAWKAWVPIYNNWITLELGGQKGWWAILAIVPILNIVSVVFMFIAMYHIGLKLRKDGAFVLVAIFLPLVWYAWLAFDSSTWKGKKPVSA